ncbi:MAG: hypothetical protein GWN00_21070, partial [Aliifodinibius sp.]|nr:hypothetical protein [Fodinibius sp.]NIV13463.1 hypothetical protein [Fodinibius sp.]NIY27206.1 hypothetical protein [Fodinibius sp.]
QLAQAQENLRRIEAAEQQASEERIKQRDKENKKLLSLDQINQKAKEKFDEQSYQQRIATAQAGLGALISLQSTNSKQAFEIGKAAAIAQALVSIPSTAIKAYESLAGIPVVGPGLGAAAAAAAVVAGTARVNQIRSQKFTAFAEGGIVPGVGNTDSVPSLLTPGEVVVPETKFKDLNFNNDSQIVILNQIKSLMQTVAENTQVNIESDDAGGTPAQNINVELQLNGDVLANQILELNRDNQRLS